MGKRSLKASISGQAKAKQALERKGWTQDYLAIQAGLSTRNSVWKFVTGRPIERSIFMELCFQLDLEWQDLADLPQDPPDCPPPIEASPSASVPSVSPLSQFLDLNTLVTAARANLQGSIQAQCATLESPFDGLTQPLMGEQLYTRLNVLPRLSNQQWLEVSDLQRSDLRPDVRNFNRLNPTVPKTIGAMDMVSSHSKVVILGKPGSGKTTFLKHIALECSAGTYKPDAVPLFIPLRLVASYPQASEGFSVLNYLNWILNRFELSAPQIKGLLENGRFIFLLDALDEIPPSIGPHVLQQIQQLGEVYYQNQIIITGRIAAQAYYFSGFSYVEMADFDEKQMTDFAQRWFSAVPTLSPPERLSKTAQFLEKLRQDNHQPIRELATTPLLLSLICSVFQERAKFPQKRSKLYEEGLEILLNRWDRSRGIQRDQIYGDLSLVEKLKLLSTIASSTFEQGHYFFEKSEVLQHIADYLLTLPHTDRDPETLWLNSTSVLKALEVQHGLLVERAKGIYSFSHLTFQEYLTARKIVASPTQETLTQSLRQLAERVTDSQWREVIRLTVSMVSSADLLLEEMKTQVDRLLAEDEPLQRFLQCIQQKVQGMETPYTAAATRAFYFGMFQGRDLNLASALDPTLASNLSAELALDLAWVRALALSASVSDRPDLERILELSFALDLEHRLQPEAAGALQRLKAELPTPAAGKESLMQWWQAQGRGWTAQLQALMIEHRQWGHSWVFSPQQQQRLRCYYDSNQFLLECLQSQCSVTPAVREAIVTALLLPWGRESECDDLN